MHTNCGRYFSQDERLHSDIALVKEILLALYDGLGYF
jgi:hypothetical protein